MLRTIRYPHRAPHIGLLMATAFVLGVPACGTRAESVDLQLTKIDASPYAVVFERDAQSRSRLYAVRPDGQAPRLLSRSFAAGSMLTAKWSHDRSMLAFTSLGRGEPLWVIKADGTGRKLLARDGVDFAWSPDDKRLVFVEGDREAPWLTVIDVDGGGRRSLTPGQWPEWSAEGRIYFVRGGVGGWPSGSFSINPDTGDERLFAVDFEAAFAPSPDGRQIAFEGRYPRDGRLRSGLFVVGAAGTGLRPLLPLNTQGIDWSPAGDQIAFVTNDSRTPGGSFFALGVINADGTGLRYLARLRCCGSLFSWSPDGTRIAFDAAYAPPDGGMPGKADVFVVNADGGRPVRVTRRLRPRGDNTEPEWVPASYLR